MVDLPAFWRYDERMQLESPVAAIQAQIDDLQFQISQMIAEIDTRSVPMWKPSEIARAAQLDFEIARLTDLLKTIGGAHEDRR